jgi:hypothetical protein
MPYGMLRYCHLHDICFAVGQILDVQRTCVEVAAALPAAGNNQMVCMLLSVMLPRTLTTATLSALLCQQMTGCSGLHGHLPVVLYYSTM